MDERFVAVNVDGKGLYVFSACSHAGIINVLQDARERFPDLPL
jgi:7,8-dihydropterin-6-yl-methyl-4-(beta-D-ribofuranosyl)aminobenzene 5'-phosphate synthase